MKLKDEIIKEARAKREHREIQEQLKSPIITADNPDCIL